MMSTERFHSLHLIDSISGLSYIRSVISECKEFRVELKRSDLDWFGTRKYESLFDSWFAYHYSIIKFNTNDELAAAEAINFFHKNALNHDAAIRKNVIGHEVANLRGIRDLAGVLSKEFYMSKYSNESDSTNLANVIKDLYIKFKVA